MKSKQKYKEERIKPHSLKVGDILYCSWGYDQTNVDYFKVSEVIGKRKIKIPKKRKKPNKEQIKIIENKVSMLHLEVMKLLIVLIGMRFSYYLDEKLSYLFKDKTALLI